MGQSAMRRPRPGALRRREAIAGWLFVAPWLFSLLVFTAYPVLASFFLSFTDYNIVEPPTWVGLQNYETAFTTDTSFFTGVYNSSYYALLSVPLALVFSFVLALVLNMRARGIGFYRTLFYLPSLAPAVAGTIVFVLLFSPDEGLVNTILGMLGLPTPGWFTDPVWSKPTLIILSLWGLGASVLIFLAGLKEVPQTLQEAAEIDGASWLQRLWHITIPIVSPVILFNLVMGVIGSFQVFTQAFIIGTTTGQPLESTLMYMLLIYRNAFKYFAMGYACALSVLLFLAILLLTLIILKTSGRWVYYEGATRAGKG